MIIFSIPSFLMNRSSLSQALCSQLPCSNLCDSLKDLALQSVRKLEKILLLRCCALCEALAAWCVRFSWSLASRRASSRPVAPNPLWLSTRKFVLPFVTQQNPLTYCLGDRLEKMSELKETPQPLWLTSTMWTQTGLCGELNHGINPYVQCDCCCCCYYL